ncbi:hypothetical protein PCE1_001397 [Barthelona sp. PCE]
MFPFGIPHTYKNAHPVHLVCFNPVYSHVAALFSSSSIDFVACSSDRFTKVNSHTIDAEAIQADWSASGDQLFFLLDNGSLYTLKFKVDVDDRNQVFMHPVHVKGFTNQGLSSRIIRQFVVHSHFVCCLLDRSRLIFFAMDLTPLSHVNSMIQLVSSEFVSHSEKDVDSVVFSNQHTPWAVRVPATRLTFATLSTGREPTLCEFGVSGSHLFMLFDDYTLYSVEIGIDPSKKLPKPLKSVKKIDIGYQLDHISFTGLGRVFCGLSHNGGRLLLIDVALGTICGELPSIETKGDRLHFSRAAITFSSVMISPVLANFSHCTPKIKDVAHGRFFFCAVTGTCEVRFWRQYSLCSTSLAPRPHLYHPWAVLKANPPRPFVISGVGMDLASYCGRTFEMPAVISVMSSSEVYCAFLVHEGDVEIIYVFSESGIVLKRTLRDKNVRALMIHNPRDREAFLIAVTSHMSDIFIERTDLRTKEVTTTHMSLPYGVCEMLSISVVELDTLTYVIHYDTLQLQLVSEDTSMRSYILDTIVYSFFVSDRYIYTFNPVSIRVYMLRSFGNLGMVKEDIRNFNPVSRQGSSVVPCSPMFDEWDQRFDLEANCVELGYLTYVFERGQISGQALDKLLFCFLEDRLFTTDSFSLNDLSEHTLLAGICRVVRQLDVSARDNIQKYLGLSLLKVFRRAHRHKVREAEILLPVLSKADLIRVRDEILSETEDVAMYQQTLSLLSVL